MMNQNLMPPSYARPMSFTFTGCNFMVHVYMLTKHFTRMHMYVCITCMRHIHVILLDLTRYNFCIC